MPENKNHEKLYKESYLKNLQLKQKLEKKSSNLKQKLEKERKIRQDNKQKFEKQIADLKQTIKKNGKKCQGWK